MQKIVLKDVTLVMPSRIIRKDLLIEDKFIAKIDDSINVDGATELDCHELIALPGAIDAHVHFREPGMESKATIYTESRAAVLGGVTSFMDMPNTMPPTTTKEALEDKLKRAQKDSVANYAFHLGASEDNIEEIKSLDRKVVPSVKIYMGSTTGNLLLDDESKLHKMFTASPIMITTHCEDSAIINARSKVARASFGDDIPYTMHPIIRNRDCCIKSTTQAIQTALDTNAKLHIMHLSTKEEVELLSHFMQGDIENRQISAEACIPHLFFSESDYLFKEGFLKCNPAVKTESDRRALLNGIKRGIITTIGTDHAPHEREYKTLPYMKCPSGLPSVQYSLLTLLDLWRRSEITLEQIPRLTAYNVAKRYDIKLRGAIEEGYYADLALIHPLVGHKVTIDDIQSKCKWSPFEGHNFKSSVVHTFVSGAHVVSNGTLTDNTNAMALSFDRD